MTKISRLALAALLALGAGGALTVAPAVAKEKAPKAAPGPKLTKAVQASLAEAQKLQQAGDNAAALVKIQAAEAAKVTDDDAYYINAIKLNVAIGLKDNAMIEQALEGALASGKLPAEEQPKYLRNLGALAMQRNDYPKALQQYERLAQVTPNDPEVIVSLAELYQRNKQTPQAISTLNKAIAAKKAAGQPVPEAWYRRQLAIAYEGKLAGETAAASAALVGAYPNAVNWRDALVIFREGKMDDQTTLDAMRLARATNALNGERDYGAYAELALQLGLSAEAKSVFDEGVAKKMLTPGPSKAYLKDLQTVIGSKMTTNRADTASLEKDARGPKGTGKLAAAAGDGYLAVGDYAKALSLYQLALDKKVADVDAVNTRRGIAFAKSGQKAEAEAAFKAVGGSGPRAQLAQLWLASLASQA